MAKMSTMERLYLPVNPIKTASGSSATTVVVLIAAHFEIHLIMEIEHLYS